MEIVNDTGLLVASLPGRIKPPQNSVTLIVKGTFRLVPNGTASLDEESEQTPPAGDECYNDEQDRGCRYESDFVLFKPRADVILVGTCHVPEGLAHPNCQVSFGINDWAKRLAVVGDRFWTNGPNGPQASDPHPFTTMPLSYEQSYGGEGFELNPIGKGFAKCHDEEGRAFWPLPNVEDPSQPLRSPNKAVTPAGFGPLGRMWPQRRQNMGTYDEKWLEERWPWFPADFDWGHFNAAPGDQQVEGYLAGDEVLQFENLHPDFPLYKTRLPGLRARCFLRETYKGQRLFREVPMKLDTLWVDMDAERAVLVWRGIAAAQSEELEELEHLMLVTEPVGQEPEPAEFYHRSLKASLAAGARQEPEMPPPEMPPPEVDEAAPTGDTGPEFEEEINAAVEAASKALESAGIDPGLVNRLIDPDQNEVAVKELLTSLNVEAADIETVYADALERAKRSFTEAGHDASLLDELAAATNPFGDDQPARSDTAAPDPLSATGSAPGEDLTGADLSGRSLKKANLKDAILKHADLSNADLAEADLSGAVLQGANLNGASLAGAKLVDADFTKACLVRADLSEGDLSGALFGEADLTGADLQAVTAKGADFTRAKLDDALLLAGEFEKANFSGSSLNRTKLDCAGLGRARFDKAAGVGTSMVGADLTELRAGGGCSFRGGQFKDVRGDQSIWFDADLSGADFTAADLKMADFRAANLAQSVFHTANIREGNLTKAVLQNASFTSVNLFRARLDKADLTDTDLSGSNCYEADFVGAVVSGTRFHDANLKMTKLAT